MGESRVVCGAHLFILPIDAQAGLELAVVGRMAPTFLSAAWHGEDFHRLGIQDVAEFDSG
jgi:hypothetical protein